MIDNNLIIVSSFSDSKLKRKIIDKRVKGAFIIDDKYVFLKGDDEALYRTDGKATEKVFG